MNILKFVKVSLINILLAGTSELNISSPRNGKTAKTVKTVTSKFKNTAVEVFFII